MASQHLFIRLNDPPASLIRPLVSGSSVHFLSNSFDGEPHPRPHPTIDESSVNLVRGNDILLHIGIRRVENRIVLDTRRGNSWDQNLQVIDLRGAFPGPGASIKVNTVGDHYEISFSGHSRVFIYTKRIFADATSVSYLSSAGTKPVFSNPLDVEVFYRVAPLSDESAGEPADATTEFAGETADAASKSADVATESTA